MSDESKWIKINDTRYSHPDRSIIQQRASGRWYVYFMGSSDIKMGPYDTLKESINAHERIQSLPDGE